MTLFLLIIAPPLLWSAVNYIDKFLLSRTSHHQHFSIDVLMLYSTAFSIVVLPLSFLFIGEAGIFSNQSQVAIQFIGGLLLTLSIYFYLKALNEEETSAVIPLALLAPVFGYILSYLLLGEILSLRQILACLIIIFGALILSLEINEGRRLRFKHGALGYMALCTFFQAGQETLFKFATIGNSFAVSIFWTHVGILAFGLAIAFFKRGALREFFISIKTSGKTVFGVNISSEALSSVAYIIRDYTILLAPVAIVMTFNAFQPVFVFLLGILLSIFAPNFIKEKTTRRHLIHKGTATAVMVLGAVMIYQTF
ncbi:MAG TPA: EamA family transporter [Candidatus Paceibacterota bacterium]|nr:EamA family transporter [Candidatus Paceibacterota bacterium]